MNGSRSQRTHAKHRLEGVGAGAQMGNRAQVFKGMALLLQRIIRSGGSLQLDGFSLDFKRLLGLGGGNQGSPYQYGGAYV